MKVRFCLLSRNSLSKQFGIEEDELLVAWITAEFQYLIKCIKGQGEDYFGSTFGSSISSVMLKSQLCLSR